MIPALGNGVSNRTSDTENTPVPCEVAVVSAKDPATRAAPRGRQGDLHPLAEYHVFAVHVLNAHAMIRCFPTSLREQFIVWHRRFCRRAARRDEREPRTVSPPIAKPSVIADSRDRVAPPRCRRRSMLVASAEPPALHHDRHQYLSCCLGQNECRTVKSLGERT
jgi:hypothetical protein